MEWIETTGATLDEAKERALDRLGVAEDEMEVEILVEGSRSMFGLRKTEARLRARVRPTSPRPKMERRDRNRRNGKKAQGGDGQKGRSRNDDQQAKKQGDKQARGKSSGQSQPEGRGKGRSRRGGRDKGGNVVAEQQVVEMAGSNETTGRSGREKGPAPKPVRENGRGSGRERAEVEAMDLQTQARITEEFVQGLLDKMGLEARVASTIEEDRLTVEAQGLNLGLAIGQQGETVRAITELSRTLVQRSSDGQAEGSLTVDIGGYRERRRSFLADFARTQAEAVLEDGRPRALEPMSAADRKVVHDTIAEIDGLSTSSEGSDADRRVVISVSAG
ncbi:MAG: R3H domain-containing nucleic acid-binding protein [Actinomycetota bacterium]|nr:R3H domain-containing nucleic acid-binding protein [Actinomycetota bacterium]